MPTHFLAAFQQAKVTACGPAAEPEMCRRYIPLSSSSQMLATAMGSQPECTHGHTDRQTLEVQQGRCPAGTSKLLYFTCTVFMSTFKRRIVQSARSTGSSEQALGFPPSWSVLRARRCRHELSFSRRRVIPQIADLSMSGSRTHCTKNAGSRRACSTHATLSLELMHLPTLTCGSLVSVVVQSSFALSSLLVLTN